MNKHILSLLFVAIFLCQQADAFMHGSWHPNPNLLSKLDNFYADKEHHVEFQTAHHFMNAFYLEIFKNQMGNKETKQAIYSYTKYLSVYLCCASQLLDSDGDIAKYPNTVDMNGYVDTFFKKYFTGMSRLEAVEILKQILPAELFLTCILFISDKHFQQEVEKYTKHTMAHYLK